MHMIGQRSLGHLLKILGSGETYSTTYAMTTVNFSYTLLVFGIIRLSPYGLRSGTGF